MNFDDVFSRISARTGPTSGAGPDGFRRLLERLGRPQDRFKIIHTAGTNGKGSVCTLLAGVLTRAGYKTGLFVSPHLISPTERIQINGAAVAKRDFASAAETVFQVEEEKLNFFEILTAAAFVYFARNKVDCAVVETGLGGRKDPTNACTPVLSIITSIGLDHTQYLGSTVAQIAREKAGIIKPGVSVLCGPADAAALRVIETAAKNARSPFALVKEGEPFFASGYDFKNGFTLLTGAGCSVWPLHALGERQTLNANIVYQAARLLGVPDEAVRRAFEEAILPGRFEILRRGNTTFVLDGAHNPQATELLMRFWRRTPFQEEAVLLCGFMKDKDFKKMLAFLRPRFKRIIVTHSPSQRGAGKTEIFPAIAPSVEMEWEEDWTRALERAAVAPFVLCTGSFYLVGAVREKLLAEAD